MASVAKYFEEREAKKPKPKWVYGDRISAKVGKVLVIGMVIRENYDIEEKTVLVHLDLPVKLEIEYQWVLYVPSRGMKKLEVL